MRGREHYTALAESPNYFFPIRTPMHRQKTGHFFSQINLTGQNNAELNSLAMTFDSDLRDAKEKLLYQMTALPDTSSSAADINHELLSITDF